MPLGKEMRTTGLQTSLGTPERQTQAVIKNAIQRFLFETIAKLKIMLVSLLFLIQFWSSSFALSFFIICILYCIIPGCYLSSNKQSYRISCYSVAQCPVILVSSKVLY